MSEHQPLTNDQISKVYRVMVTTGELVAARGYVLSDEWCPKRMEDFRTQFCQLGYTISRDKMFLFTNRVDDTSRRLQVHFNGQPSVTTQDIKDYVNKAIGSGAGGMPCQDVILVCDNPPNPAAKKYIEECRSSQGVNIEVFSEDELVVNITKHELVPQHEPLSEEEAKEVLGAFKLEKNQLPRILVKDPIARFYGMKRGQVVRITRKSETAGVYITLRQVV